MTTVLFAGGITIAAVTAASVIFTIVLPREPRGFERHALLINRIVRFLLLGVARVARTYERKDAVLAVAAPVALVGQLAFWAACFVLAFAMVLERTTHHFAWALAQSAGALFSVGTIDVSGPRNVAADLAAGTTWVVIVALQIAYLPSLYGAFNRRESLVAMLESRAGLPAWGPEVLVRHQLVGITDTLPDLYSAWEQWAAEVAESHTTYPVMLLFRSPEPWFSWLIGLLAVMDGAALHLAIAPTTASSQARLCLRMGFTTLNRIAKVLGWKVDPDPNPAGPIQLTFAEFEQAVQMLEHVGFAMERSAEAAWPDFVGWRINYETTAYRLASWVTAPPAPWSGTRRHLRAGVVAPRRPPQRRPGHPDSQRPDDVSS